jgi:hypothetical protein
VLWTGHVQGVVAVEVTQVKVIIGVPKWHALRKCTGSQPHVMHVSLRVGLLNGRERVAVDGMHH